MTELDDDARPEPPMAGDETATLLGSLERQRATLAWKCSGVDAAGMRATVGVSAVSLGGLLKHMALVEGHTFGWKLWRRPLGPPWVGVDFEADPEWEWRTAAHDSPADLLANWAAAVERSRALVVEALAEDGPGTMARLVYPDGRQASLRRLLVDMIEEYARHVGHADLIRESVDGLVGEDPPWP